MQDSKGPEAKWASLGCELLIRDSRCGATEEELRTSNLPD